MPSCGPGSVVGTATGYGLDGPRIESRWGARFSAPVQTGPGAYPASCTMGTGSFPGVNSGRGATLTPHPLLVPWSWKGRAIPLLPLWAVRPVQSLSACTMLHFTFLYVTESPRQISSGPFKTDVNTALSTNSLAPTVASKTPRRETGRQFSARFGEHVLSLTITKKKKKHPRVCEAPDKGHTMGSIRQ